MNAQVPGGGASGGVPSGFDRLILLVGRLNHGWDPTESLLVDLIAGLSGSGRDAATAVFKALGTTQARLDLIARLAGMESTPFETRARILPLAGRMRRLSELRDHYNRCICALDPESGDTPALLRRIAGRGRCGQPGRMAACEDDALAAVAQTLADLRRLDRDFRAAIPRGDLSA